MERPFRPISVVALRGGFGNQLFAWAYGQGLRSKGFSVLYDPGNRLGRGFALSGLIPRRRIFPLPAFFWRKLVRSRPGVEAASRILRAENQLLSPNLTTQQSALTFYWGYWQSLDYFCDAKHEIYKKLIAWLDLPVRDKVTECAIHVRRGDYVSDSGAAAVMGVLPLSYYVRSVRHMKSLGYKSFVVYSDERSWVRENLLPLDPTLRLADTDESDDFSNMARSGALITANSSFSWWAGFLVENAGGSVVAPRVWFADAGMNSSRIIPDAWTAL